MASPGKGSHASATTNNVTFVAILEQRDTAQVASTTMTGTLNLQAGDLVIVTAAYATGASSTVTVGGNAATLINSNTATTQGYTLDTFYLANASANASASVVITYNASSDFRISIAAQYRGAATASALDVSSKNTGTSGMTDSPNMTALDVTTTNAANLLIFAGVNNGNHATQTPQGSWTKRTAVATKNWVFADKLVTTTGSNPGGTVIAVDSTADNFYFSSFAAFKSL